LVLGNERGELVEASVRVEKAALLLSEIIPRQR
jgi:hypothetical protein